MFGLGVANVQETHTKRYLEHEPPEMINESVKLVFGLEAIGGVLPVLVISVSTS